MSKRSELESKMTDDVELGGTAVLGDEDSQLSLGVANVEAESVDLHQQLQLNVLRAVDGVSQRYHRRILPLPCSLCNFLH